MVEETEVVVADKKMREDILILMLTCLHYLELEEDVVDLEEEEILVKEVTLEEEEVLIDNWMKKVDSEVVVEEEEVTLMV